MVKYNSLYYIKQKSYIKIKLLKLFNYSLLK